jgi:hypothetical protein
VNEGNKAKRGRPVKEVDWELFKNLCEIHCTMSEISYILDINDDVLRVKIKEKFGMNFQEAHKKFSAFGKRTLRRDQFKLAKRNASMSIWLGKQYLDQKDTLTDNEVGEETNNKYLDVIGQLAALQSKASFSRASKDSSST